MRFEKIKIENFRGIKELELGNFTDINIFIGKNSTGKSTVLEAIYLLGCKFHMDFIGNHCFKVILENRGYSKDSLFDIGKEIIHKKRPQYITLSSSDDSSYLIRVSNTIDPDDYKYLKERPDISFEGKYYVVFLVDKKIKNENKGFCYQIIWYYEKENKLDAFTFYNPDFKDEILYSNKIVFITENELRNIQNISKAYKTYIDQVGWKAKEEFIKTLSEKYKEIKDIELANNLLRIIFEDYAISVSSLADGLKSLLLTSIYLNMFEEGIICIEEPENHLHLGLHDKYIQKILESVKTNKNQIFISTHSIEFLESLLNKAQEANVDVNVYKFKDLVNGKPDIAILSRDSALELIKDLEMDLRL